MLCLFFFCILGTKIVPCDFIAPVESQNPLGGGLHHEVCMFSVHVYMLAPPCVVCVWVGGGGVTFVIVETIMYHCTSSWKICTHVTSIVILSVCKFTYTYVYTYVAKGAIASCL